MNRTILERVIPPSQLMKQKALDHLHKLVQSKKDRQSIEGHAFNIVRAFGKGLDMNARALANLYRQTYMVKENSAAIVGTSRTNNSAAMPPSMKQIVVVDRRYRKDKPPVIRKKWRRSGF